MKTNNYNFTNDWLAGFTQSDGSFVVSIERQQSGIPIRPRPVFNLTQSNIDFNMFVELKKIFRSR